MLSDQEGGVPRESNDITFILVILQEDGDLPSGREGGVRRENNDITMILGDTSRGWGYTVRSRGRSAKGK